MAGNARDQRHLNRALNVAWASTERSRHGCVIAHGKRVLAVGVNSRRVHPNQSAHPELEASFHAEVAAIRALNTTVPYSKLTVYVARADAGGYPLLSKPCARCTKVLKSLGFGRVVWTTN